MKTERIDFISEYCDRWCERCTFTARCSLFAATAAIAMCGDVDEGLELAAGAPCAPDSNDAVREQTGPFADFEFVEPAAEQIAALDRAYEERRRRVASLPVMQAAKAYCKSAFRWLGSHGGSFGGADVILREALEIVTWDHTMIPVKLDRALSGRDDHQQDQYGADDHPVQNDWNGTAKLVLILLERSEVAWRTIGQATRSDAAGEMTAQLASIRAEVEREFPRARQFVRPGFDEQYPV